MDPASVVAWERTAAGSLALLGDAVHLLEITVEGDDLGELAWAAGFLGALVRLVGSTVPLPEDHELYGHWRRLLALYGDAADEVRRAATETRDLTPVAPLTHRIAEEVRALAELFAVARARQNATAQ